MPLYGKMFVGVPLKGMLDLKYFKSTVVLLKNNLDNLFIDLKVNMCLH